MKTRPLLAIVGAILLVLAAFLIWRYGIGPLAGTLTGGSDVVASAGTPGRGTESAGINQGAPADTVIPKAVMDKLRSRFSRSMGDKRIQIAFLDELLKYLKYAYPNDWKLRIYDALKAVFPELADQLFKLYTRLDEYNTWVLENRSSMTGMSNEERHDVLWDKRREIFGPEADEIWASEIQRRKIKDALDTIANSKGIPLSEKISEYQGAIQEAYGSEADNYIKKSRQELMDDFLEVESVQADLHSMSPEERKESLREIRKSMQMDKAALSRWDKLDQVRDSRWEKGQQYMIARERIVKNENASNQAQKLDDLRRQSFGPEADTIRNEEESGFFRFTEKRVYGMN